MTKPTRIGTVQLIIELLKNPDRKPLLQIGIELVYLVFLYREIPTHYFSRYLFRRDRINIANYLPRKFLYNLKSKFNEGEVRGALDNKLYFDFFYKQFNIPLPKILMYNHRRAFVINNESFRVNSGEEYLVVLKKLMEDTSEDSIFIKKTYWSYEGRNVYKITKAMLIENPIMIYNLYPEIIKTGFLYQQTISQHQALNKLNSSCLNTIRLDTFIDKAGNVNLISGYLKTNVKNNFIDNEASGSCEIPVDMETGKLKKYGHLSLKYNGLAPLTEHPISRVPFENFAIPYFEEAKQLIVRAAGYMPGLRLIGWDVGISDSGPILVEGNSDYGIPANDLAYGGYKTNPVFQKVIQEFNEM